MLNLERLYQESKSKCDKVLQSIADRYNVSTSDVLEVLEEVDCLRHYYLHTSPRERLDLVKSFDSYSSGGAIVYTNPYFGRLYNFCANLDKLDGEDYTKGFVDLTCNPYLKWRYVIFSNELNTKLEFKKFNAPEFIITHSVNKDILLLLKKIKVNTIWITNKYLIASTSNFDLYLEIWDLPIKFAVPIIGEFIGKDVSNISGLGFHRGIVSLEANHRYAFGYPSSCDIPLDLAITPITTVSSLEEGMQLMHQGDRLQPMIKESLINTANKLSDQFVIGFNSNFDMVIDAGEYKLSVPYKFDLCVEERDTPSDLHCYCIDLEVDEEIEGEEEDWWD